jgi:hypothetical protein
MQHFGSKISWERTTWKTEKDGRITLILILGKHCEVGRLRIVSNDGLLYCRC